MLKTVVISTFLAVSSFSAFAETNNNPGVYYCPKPAQETGTLEVCHVP